MKRYLHTHPIRAQQGISLYTLLAAVVVLGVLTSVLVTSFSGEHTKIAALTSLMKTIGQAANQYHLDTTCYPTDMRELMSYTGNPNYNSCQATIPENQWKGPYIKKHTVTNDGLYAYDHYKPNTQLGFTEQLGSGSRNSLKAGAHGVALANPRLPQAKVNEMSDESGGTLVNIDKDGPQGMPAYIYARE